MSTRGPWPQWVWPAADETLTDTLQEYSARAKMVGGEYSLTRHAIIIGGQALDADTMIPLSEADIRNRELVYRDSIPEIDSIELEGWGITDRVYSWKE